MVSHRRTCTRSVDLSLSELMSPRRDNNVCGMLVVMFALCVATIQAVGPGSFGAVFHNLKASTHYDRRKYNVGISQRSDPGIESASYDELFGRRKRGAPSAAIIIAQLGKSAVRRLLSGAKPLDSTSSRAFRVFKKPGFMNNAISDFESVKPSYVMKYKNKQGVETLEGRVGDRHLFLTVRGEEQIPTLDIITYSKAKVDIRKRVYGQPIDRIIYKNGD